MTQNEKKESHDALIVSSQRYQNLFRFLLNILVEINETMIDTCDHSERLNVSNKYQQDIF